MHRQFVPTRETHHGSAVGADGCAICAPCAADRADEVDDVADGIVDRGAEVVQARYQVVKSDDPSFVLVKMLCHRAVNPLIVSVHSGFFG